MSFNDIVSIVINVIVDNAQCLGHIVSSIINFDFNKPKLHLNIDDSKNRLVLIVIEHFEHISSQTVLIANEQAFTFSYHGPWFTDSHHSSLMTGLSCPKINTDHLNVLLFGVVIKSFFKQKYFI